MGGGNLPHPLNTLGIELRYTYPYVKVNNGEEEVVAYDIDDNNKQLLNTIK